MQEDLFSSVTAKHPPLSLSPKMLLRLLLQTLVPGKSSIETTGNFKKGKWEGSWIHEKNGTLLSKGTYKDDKKDGPWVGYHKNGQLLSKGTFKNGVKVYIMRNL